MNRREDCDPITRLILLVIVIIVGIFVIAYVSVYAYKEITTHNLKIEQAKVVNKEIMQLYEICEILKLDLITKKELYDRKVLYEDQELESQRKCIIDTQTKISKTLTPVGTYVYLIDDNRAVRVKALYGYQAFTYEGVCFMVCDTESYKLLSYREYSLCKKLEKGGKND